MKYSLFQRTNKSVNAGTIKEISQRTAKMLITKMEGVAGKNRMITGKSSVILLSNKNQIFITPIS